MDPDTTHAEAIVARQLDAYNARDIDAFMAAWHDDAERDDLVDRSVGRVHPARGAVEEDLTRDLGAQA